MFLSTNRKLPEEPEMTTTTTKDRWNAYKVTLPVLEQLSVRVYNAWHAENGNDGIEPTS